MFSVSEWKMYHLTETFMLLGYFFGEFLIPPQRFALQCGVVVRNRAFVAKLAWPADFGPGSELVTWSCLDSGFDQTKCVGTPPRSGLRS